MKSRFHISKMLRRTACATTALLIAVSVPLEALSAEFTVGTSDELANSWSEANQNADTSNSFYITNDIDMNSYTLQAEADKKYTVSSASGGDYELSNVRIEGSGSRVTLNTDITAQDSTALTVLGDMDVTVRGDIIQTSATTANGNYVAVEAANGAELIIEGNVTMAEAGLSATNGAITVRGDVTLKSEGDDTYNNYVIDADMDSTVIVRGDVVTEELGVLAMRDSTVVVYGDLTQESTGNIDVNSSVISASEGTVQVNGNVSSEEGGITAYKSSVSVGKDLVVDAGENACPTAVSANNHSSVKVGGTLISSGNGIETMNSSSVTVNDGMIVDGSALNVDKSTVTITGDVTSEDYSLITNGSTVKIYGDFGLNPNENEGVYGELVVSGGSTLYMGSETMLEADAAHVLENSTLDAALINADAVSVGVSGNSKDTSKFDAFANSADTNIGTLTTGGKSTSIIKGSAGDIYATENSYVEVWLDAKSVTRTGNARVITNVANTTPKNYLPEPDPNDYAVGNTTANTIIALCQSYTTNSTLQKQTSELRSLLTDVSVDISNELNGGSALWTSIFDHENINITSYMDGRDQYQEFYHNENYNVDSKIAFAQADEVNTYLVSMFKNNLAQAMVDLSNSDERWKEKGGEDAKILAKILASTSKLEDASGAVLSAAEKDYLSKIADANGYISGPKMLDFLQKFGYFKDGDPNSVLRAQQLSRSYNKLGPYMQDAKLFAKLAKAGVTLLDLLEYNMADYSSHIIVLDEILATQELSPEMYAAAVELRVSMENKALGSLEKILNQLKKDSVGAIKKLVFAPLEIGQAVLDIAGLITGGSKDAQDLQNGAALAIMAPQLLESFESSILKVQNGDTSEEAVQMVYMNYMMTRRAIANMCDIMTNIGNWKQEKEYKAILAKLESMELGNYVDLVQ